MKAKLVAAFGAVFVLAGCATDYGVTRVSATFNPDGKVQSFDWATGTEKAEVDVQANVLTGEIRYRARDVLAFDGQRIAAEVYRGLTEAGVNVSEAVVRGVVTGVLGTGAIQAGGQIIGASTALEAAKLKAASKAAGGTP